jgi:hypothetical protein
MKTPNDKRKISVRMWLPLLKKFNQQCAKACLNRDAYFDTVLANEARMLRFELKGQRNSDVACKYIKRCFAELPEHVPVSLALSVATSEAVNEACDEVNVWRDVFVNRVAYLLVAPTKAIESQLSLTLNDYKQEIFDDGWEIKALLLGPRLAAIAEFVSDDPFAGLRSALLAAYPETKGALHAQALGKPGAETRRDRSLAGLSVYLEDANVPGTESYAKQSALLEELMKSLDFSPQEEPIKKQRASPERAQRKPIRTNSANDRRTQ